VKLGKVRVGERFVFDDRGGVFQRISWEKARCIYGSNFGTEIDINPDISVYAIFDRDRSMRLNKREEPDTESQAPLTASVPVSIIPAPVSETAGSSAVPGIWTQNTQTMTTPIEGVIRVVFVDEEDKLVGEIPAASAVQVAALTKSDFIKLAIDGVVKIFRVSDVGFDNPNQILSMCVEESD
jgi:hypothetical protein